MALELNRNFDISFLLSKQKIVLFILTAVLSLLFAAGVYKNQKQKVRRIEREIKEEERLNRIVDDIKLQEKEFTGYLTEFGERDSTLIMKEVSEYARASGVRVSSLIPQKRIDSGILRILEFNIAVEGFYHQLGGFLSRIESSPTVLRVVRFDLSKAPVLRKKRRKEQDRGNILNADIAINAVFIKE